MKKKHILFFLFCFVLTGISAQTLEQAKVMFNKKQYSEAKPVFKKYVKSQPANGNYNLWYGDFKSRVENLKVYNYCKE